MEALFSPVRNGTDVVDNTDETDGCRFLTASTSGSALSPPARMDHDARSSC